MPRGRAARPGTTARPGRPGTTSRHSTLPASSARIWSEAGTGLRSAWPAHCGMHDRGWPRPPPSAAPRQPPPPLPPVHRPARPGGQTRRWLGRRTQNRTIGALPTGQTAQLSAARNRQGALSGCSHGGNTNGSRLDIAARELAALARCPRLGRLRDGNAAGCDAGPSIVRREGPLHLRVCLSAAGGKCGGRWPGGYRGV